MHRKCAFPQHGQLRVVNHRHLKCFNEGFATQSINRIGRLDYRKDPNVKDLGFGLRVLESNRFPDVNSQVLPRPSRNAKRIG